MSVFNAADPNGTWSLFVADHAAGDVGNIAGGWSLSLTMISPVNQLADLVLAGAAAPNPVLAGGALTYTFTVTNSGPNAATFAAFSNNLPAGVTLLSVSSSQGSLLTNATSVVANLGPLNVGSNAIVTVTILPSASNAGLLTNTATVASSETDLNLANNSVAVVTSVNLPLADVGLSLIQVPNPATIGLPLTNSITVTNRGPGTALELALTNAIPPGFTLVSATSTLGTPATSGGAITCQFGDVPANTGAIVKFPRATRCLWMRRSPDGFGTSRSRFSSAGKNFAICPCSKPPNPSD